MPQTQNQKHNESKRGSKEKKEKLNGVGARLKSAREQNGITLNKVSEDLRILHRHLVAIEREDYDNLPQKPFVRGFITNYAKYLKLDTSSILTAFNASYPSEYEKEQVAPSTKPIKPMGKLSRGSSRKTSFGKLGGLLALVGCVALAFLYFTSDKNNLSAGQTQEAPATTVVDSLVIEDTQSNAATQSIATDTSNTNTSADANVVGVASVDAAENAADTNLEKNLEAELKNTEAELQKIANPNAAPAELVFWVRKKTDITITDQTGTVIMDGTKSRGEHRATGKPPFKLNISRAANVSLNMDTVPQNKKMHQSVKDDGSVSFILTKS